MIATTKVMPVNGLFRYNRKNYAVNNHLCEETPIKQVFKIIGSNHTPWQIVLYFSTIVN